MSPSDSIERFLTYLRIRTDQPAPDYGAAIEFLSSVGKAFDLACQTVLIAQGKPAIVMTLTGQDPSLPSVFLNSHMDVVPAFPEFWKCDPFSGHLDYDGKIYGRGTQDMKSSVQSLRYLEAIHRLKMGGAQLKRTIHICFVPDEEIGGVEGMRALVEMEEFRRLNVGICLDEGLASEDDIYRIYYAERSVWWLRIIASGNAGHGSQFIENTAAEKLVRKFFELRKQEKLKLMSNKNLSLGDVISVNLTILKGGIQQNVVPSHFVASKYVQLRSGSNLPTYLFKALQRRLNQWTEEAALLVKKESSFVHKRSDLQYKPMSPQSSDDPWWKTICNLFTYSYSVASSIGRQYLQKGIVAYGFSPIVQTPILLHDHNEYLHRDTYLKGIETYVHLIKALANVPAN
ncbi:aminoacylase 1A [Trichuris trichiura]|uniref:Aminoacylase 1A n=1 Tax=Trichuris trichiura TaxID=36087 RepID=A0A077YWT3_TRITR|nr:aminoacylase 1A [Trichuris trichiura]